jgi:hypothetical protein
MKGSNMKNSNNLTKISEGLVYLYIRIHDGLYHFESKNKDPNTNKTFVAYGDYQTCLDNSLAHAQSSGRGAIFEDMTAKLKKGEKK